MALIDDVSYGAEQALRTLSKRCLECPKQMPSCPRCPTGKVCSLVPGDCNKCAYMTCIADPATTTAPQGPNVGAIAGGVVAGVAFVAIAVFLVWRFWIKKQREEQDRELEEKWKEEGGASRRSQIQSSASSTRTRASLATSILSRASNIIQIAYIPGVTNRGNDNIPVPPIPAAFRSGQQTPKSPLSNEGDMLFFRPGDLRASTWSDSSSFMTPGNRDTQYTVHSITPSLARSSVASDAFFVDDATAAPMPTHSFKPPAPRMVSIKSNGSTPSPEDPTEKSQTLQIMMPGNTPRNMSGSVVRAKQIQLSNGKGRLIGGGNTTKSPLSSLGDLAEADEEGEAATETTTKADSVDTPSPPLRSPFDDPPEPSSPIDSPPSPNRRPNPYASMASKIRRSTDLNPRRGSKSIGGLAVIQESARNSGVPPSVEAEDEKSEKKEVPKQDSSEQQEEAKPRASEDSPFSDAHASE